MVVLEVAEVTEVIEVVVAGCEGCCCVGHSGSESSWRKYFEIRCGGCGSGDNLGSWDWHQAIFINHHILVWLVYEVCIRKLR